MKRKLAAAFVVALLTAAGFSYVNCGVTVTVQNVGGEPLNAVVVHVTGGSRALGDIPAGECQTVRVSPAGESHVEIQHDQGRLLVETYFEPGYQGNITVDVTRRDVVRVKNSIRIGPIGLPHNPLQPIACKTRSG